MNWDQLQGKWKQFTGEATRRWGKLTDDDMDEVSGNREKLEGKLQEKYGYTKEQAGKEIDEWSNGL